ncbi:MAG: PQQ-binding-like beta-propeller repeat protein [SAR324 cluster bacterium]|nr:PQQ-binding-like beta-propeller repeat protein [SAR324 cluster bacterium]
MSALFKVATGACLGLSLILLPVSGVQAAPVTDILLEANPASSWLHANGNWAAYRYSELRQINPANAGDLGAAWVFNSGAKNDPQMTPLYHDGLVYYAQDNQLWALDGGTGRVVWKYTHEIPEDYGGYNADFVLGKHRGVAIMGETVFMLSTDSKLHGVDYKTGEQKFVKQYLTYPKDFEMAEDSNGYAITVGPLAILGQIIVPLNATDFGGLPGFVDGVNPCTGESNWRANMIPGPGEPGADTWPGNSADYGGAGPWMTGSWDAELERYFTGTANAYPWNPAGRGGGKEDNVGAASLVAINTSDGSVAWRYTAVPGDPWDYDTQQTPLIIDVNGKKTIVHPNKTGFIHYLDIDTGRFLRATPFADKITWVEGYDRNGRPINQIALPIEGGDQVEVYPALFGGTNMYPHSYSPLTGLIYLAAANNGMMYGFEKIQVISNVRHFGATMEFMFGYEVNLAMDANSGKEVWRDQKSLPGYSGGMFSTAGDIVAYVSANGDATVTNSSTGEILWTFNMGATGKAGGITYMHDGTQYILQSAGGIQGFGNEAHPHSAGGGYLIAFTLR